MMSVSYSYEPDRPSENASSPKSIDMLVAGRAFAHDDARQSFLALEADQEILEATGSTGSAGPCSCGTRSVQFSRRGSATGAVTILKSLAPSALVRMKKTSPPSSMSYCSPVSRGATSFGSAPGSLAGMTRYSDVSWSLMAMKIQSLRAAAADAHEEARIGFLEDQPVFGAVACRAGGRRSSRGGDWVEPGVEETVIAGAPYARAAAVGDVVGEVGAAVEIANHQREELRALVVIGPQQLAVVRRVVDIADPEIRLAFAFHDRRRGRHPRARRRAACGRSAAARRRCGRPSHRRTDRPSSAPRNRLP